MIAKWKALWRKKLLSDYFVEILELVDCAIVVVAVAAVVDVAAPVDGVADCNVLHGLALALSANEIKIHIYTGLFVRHSDSAFPYTHTKESVHLNNVRYSRAFKSFHCIYCSKI